MNLRPIDLNYNKGTRKGPRPSIIDQAKLDSRLVSEILQTAPNFRTAMMELTRTAYASLTGKLRNRRHQTVKAWAENIETKKGYWIYSNRGLAQAIKDGYVLFHCIGDKDKTSTFHHVL